MAQSTPAAAASKAAAANAPRDMNSVVNNIPNLFKMDREGKLGPTQAIQLRSLIASQARLISLRSALKGESPNPLTTLPQHLNPTIASPNPNGGAALRVLTSAEKFNEDIQAGISEAARVGELVIPLPQLSKMLKDTAEKRQADLAKDNVLRTRFNYSVAWYTKQAEGFTIKEGKAVPHIPPTAAGAANTPRTASANTSPAGTPGLPGAASTNVVRPQPPPTIKKEVEEPVQDKTLPAGSSSTDPPQAASSSSIVKTEDNNPLSSIPRPSAPAGPSITQPPAPPPVPAEPEDRRRKRKVNEWLREMKPGMDFEVGVHDIWSEVLDGFVQEAARGAVKLAKHRKSDRVSVRDVALFLDNTYGISVPGYNTHAPDRIHLAPEIRDRDNRNKKVVAPNAARLARAKAVANAAASGGKGKEEE